jgi:uncharacterized protein
VKKNKNTRYNEYKSLVNDLMDSRVVASMIQYPQHGDYTTLDHCLNVSFKSYTWCKSWGLDYRAAARGGLLHDLYLYDWHKPNPYKGLHAFSHPSTALKNASEHFELTNKEKDIIEKHMWPLTILLPRSFEALIVSATDKYCALTETFRSGTYLRGLFKTKQ